MVYKEIAFSSYYSYCAFVLVKNKVSDLYAKYEGGSGDSSGRKFTWKAFAFSEHDGN